MWRLQLFEGLQRGFEDNALVKFIRINWFSLAHCFEVGLGNVDKEAKFSFELERNRDTRVVELEGQGF
jgi:hypothetical protein